MIYELVIIALFYLEFICEITHLYFDAGRDFRERYVNTKLISKLTLLALFTIDASYYYNYYNTDSLRIARYFRPCNPFTYNFNS